MSKENFNLLVVAHPDDESLFFAGLLLSQQDHPWKIVCVTDGNADGKGKARMQEFRRACKRLGSEDPINLNYPDVFDRRLPLADLQKRLMSFAEAQTVATHGPLGEYGHPHHQDVCRAVHETFRGRAILSPAYNCYPDLHVHLTPAQFLHKAEILRDIYLGETQRFIQFYPTSAAEGFVAFSYKEVCALYDYLASNQDLHLDHLHHYRWFIPYLPSLREHSKNRPF